MPVRALLDRFLDTAMWKGGIGRIDKERSLLLVVDSRTCLVPALYGNEDSKQAIQRCRIRDISRRNLAYIYILLLSVLAGFESVRRTHYVFNFHRHHVQQTSCVRSSSISAGFLCGGATGLCLTPELPPVGHGGVDVCLKQH